MGDKLRVLVVEDEDVLLHAIGTKMELQNIEPILCPSGQAALAELQKGNIPDVIWLDYYLSDMDGIAFMAKVDENPAWKDIPIVVVSNSASQEKVNAMMLNGAKKYLVKAEYKLADIISIVEQYARE